MYYTSSFWITEYGIGGELSSNTFGYQNIWIGHYPTNLTSNMHRYNKNTSWKMLSIYVFRSKIDAYFDINQDYGGHFKIKDLLDNGNDYYFKNTFLVGNADLRVVYGRPEDVSYFGDWNRDGKKTTTVRRENIFHIKNSISYGSADIMIAYGKPDDEIFIGDWNGDQVDGLVVRRLNAYHIKNNLTTSGVAERVVTYGKATDRVYFGDWTGTGLESIVVRR